MYASLVTAGASALYDLYKSATSKTGSTDAASSTASDQSSATSSTDASTIGAVGSTSTSGSKFSDALNKLFTDIQSSTTGTANATSNVADDLQSLSKGLKTGGAHGGHHHHGAAPADDAQSADAQSASTDGSSTSSPFQGLASSLVAYAKTQSLGASTSTSLTA